MSQSKHEFYLNGMSGNKRPDIVIDLRRPDIKKSISIENKQDLINFFFTAEASYKAFKEKILSSIEAPQQ